MYRPSCRFSLQRYVHGLIVFIILLVTTVSDVCVGDDVCDSFFHKKILFCFWERRGEETKRE